MNKTETNCYCGQTQPYTNCCGPFHEGKKRAETAEKLMRSRYSAYVAGKIGYIAETNDPQAKDDFDREAAETWSKESEWLGLEIVAAKEGQPGDPEGEVEFIARYKAAGVEHTHHEVSLFRPDLKTKGWYYVDGKTMREPERRAEPKVGRNDPCACGSGKKFKKCCSV
ncbi:MAG: YchJ family protein [Bdellovibrionales bacterium]|nr:YchJ family protein [Oligoflexia bacterium]